MVGIESAAQPGPTLVPPPLTQATIAAVSQTQAMRQREQARQDRELLRAVAAGDEGAVGRLYDRYAGLLMAVARRMLGNPSEAEDLVHDVFVEAWRNAVHYDPARGTVRTWLLVRCRSRALDRLRSPRRSRATDLAEVPESPTGPEADPSREADRTRLRSGIGMLKPEHRVLIELAYFHGLSSREIADKEGLPLGTVKSRIAAAMRKLRAALADPSSPQGARPPEGRKTGDKP